MFLRNLSCRGPVAVLLVVFLGLSKSETFPECDSAKDGSYIGSPLSCSSYIYCDGDSSFSGTCGDDERFNELFQTCDPANEVACDLDDTSSSSSPVSSTPVTPMIPTFTAPSVETTVGSSTSSSSSSSLASTASSSTPLTSSTSSSTSTPFIPSTPEEELIPDGNGIVMVGSSCPQADKPGVVVLVPHPKSCSAYYICFHNELIQMQCSAMLHFDVKSGKCDYPETALCQADNNRPRDQCLPHTVDLYPHPTNCNYFYLCKSGYLMLQQCPFHFGWDYQRRACVAASEAKCYRN